MFSQEDGAGPLPNLTHQVLLKHCEFKGPAIFISLALPRQGVAESMPWHDVAAAAACCTKRSMLAIEHQAAGELPCKALIGFLAP